MAHDAPAGTVEHYRTRLTVMKDRLSGQIAAENEGVRDAASGPDHDGVLHTHNADMDSEGVDAAVGRSRSLHAELDQVAGALNALTPRDGGQSVDGDEKARLDLLLSTQDFAEELDRKFAPA